MDKNQLIFETNSTFYCLLSRLVLTETLSIKTIYQIFKSQNLRHFKRGAIPDYRPFNVLLLVRTYVILFSYTCLSTYAFLYVRLVCVDMHYYVILFLVHVLVYSFYYSLSCICAYVIFRFILVFVHMLYFVLYLYLCICYISFYTCICAYVIFRFVHVSVNLYVLLFFKLV